MSLAEKITEDVKSALKGGDKKKLSIARYLSSELKNYLIKENLDRELSNLTDENFYKIVKTQVKQKKESLEFAEKASDPEKVEEIKYDINYLNSYLPQLMSKDDTKKIIDAKPTVSRCLTGFRRSVWSILLLITFRRYENQGWTSISLEAAKYRLPNTT